MTGGVVVYDELVGDTLDTIPTFIPWPHTELNVEDSWSIIASIENLTITTP